MEGVNVHEHGAGSIGRVGDENVFLGATCDRLDSTGSVESIKSDRIRKCGANNDVAFQRSRTSP